jgi:RNA polymerase sigma-70 factor (ECF subfamily)
LTQAQTIALYHPLLHHIAFKLLKCKADAEDIVQDTFLRWLSLDHKVIENTKAYLVKAVTNNCLNHLNAIKRKKMEYLESIHFPDFIAQIKEMDFSHLDIQAEVKSALQVIHSKLQPLERAVYLLREVFDFDYDALQVVLDKKKEHCRQLFSRARRKIEETNPLSIKVSGKPQFLESFLKACRIGEASELVAALKKDTKPASLA